jgi:hypothetical protein
MAMAGMALCCPGVELAGGVEQRADLSGAVEVAAPRLARP